MRNVPVDLGPRFASGHFGVGEDVAKPDISTTFVGWVRSTPPNQLCLYDPSRHTHVATKVSDTDFRALRAVDPAAQGGALSKTQREQAQSILKSIGMASSGLTDAQLHRAAVLVGTGEVTTGWLKANIGALNAPMALEGERTLLEAHTAGLQQARSALGDPAIARNTQLAQSIAKRAVDDHGTVDLVYIREMKRQLETEPPLPEMPQGPYRKHLVTLLNKLDTDAAFRGRLENVGSPQGNQNPAHNVIRGTLGLPGNHAVTDADARRAVLSAMLAELRQGPVGSCFATAIGIMIHDEQPARMLEGLKALVETGSLPGSVQVSSTSPRVAINLPINKTLHGGTYDTDLTVHGDGFVTSAGDNQLPKKLPLRDMPGMDAALRALGFRDPAVQQNALDGAVQTLVGAPILGFLVPTADITPRQIIEALAPTPEKRELAADAFRGATENRLLRAWEYTLAGYVQSDAGGKTQSRFTAAIQDQLTTDRPLRPLPNGATSEQQSADSLLRGFRANFAAAFDARLELVYNAQKTIPGSDGRSTAGGFDQFISEPTGRNKIKLSRAADLEGAVAKIFEHETDQLHLRLELQKQPNSVWNTVENEIEQLRKVVTSPSFASDVVTQEKAHQENDLYESMSLGIVRHQFDVGGTPATSRLRASNIDGARVLDFVITSLRDVQTRIGGNHDRDLRAFSLPAENGVHVFLIKPNADPRFTALWQGSQEVDDVLPSLIHPPELQKFTRSTIAEDRIRELVASLDPNHGATGDGVIGKLRATGQPWTPAAFADALFTSFRPAAQTHSQRAALEEYLSQELGAPALQPIAFADSSWGGGDVQKFLGVIHNPFTDKPEVWIVDHNGRSFTASAKLDQAKYVQGGWGMFTDPLQLGRT